MRACLAHVTCSVACISWERICFCQENEYMNEYKWIQMNINGFPSTQGGIQEYSILHDLLHVEISLRVFKCVNMETYDIGHDVGVSC